MKKFSKSCKNAIFLLPIFLTVVFVLPGSCAAYDQVDVDIHDLSKHLELPNDKVEEVLHYLIGVFHSDWVNLEISGQSTAEQRAVPQIMKKAVRVQALNHLMVEAPLDIAWGIIKGALKIAKLVGTQTVDISDMVGEIEKESVKKAIAFGMEKLFENNIRVTPGAIEFKYNSRDKKVKSVIIQYIVIYKPIDKKTGDLEIRFYSPKSLTPPENKGSAGMSIGMCTDLTHDLPPFIVTIQGKAENYKWLGNPVVKTEFPSEVIDFGIKPVGLIEKKFLKPLEQTIKEVEIIITKATGKTFGIVDTWNKIKDFFAKNNPFSPAGLVQFSSEENQEEKTMEYFAEKVLENNPQPEVVIVEEIIEQAQGFEVKEKNIIEEISEEKIEKEEELIIEDKVEEVEEKEPTVEIEIVEEIEKKKETILCEKSAEANRNEVIFNEIAWMGTNISGNDEWFEIKNISQNEIDLTGWQILDKEKQIKIIFDKTILSAGRIILLERTDDETIPSLAADLIYTGALNDYGEVLYLFGQNCLLKDEIVADPDWPAGEKSARRAMERSSDFNWRTYSGSGENSILGTPKKENSSEPEILNFLPAPPPPIIQQSEELIYSVPQILITEIQIRDAASSNHDFIELYNPSINAVDISNFQLKKKNSNGNESSIRVFPENSVIAAQNYFLWANSNYASSTDISANIISSRTLAADNSVALFDDRDNIVDAVAWGSSTNPFSETTVFGQNPEASQVIGRKWSAISQDYVDTDNNQDDFEIQEPTPRQRNQAIEVSLNEPPTAQFNFSPEDPLMDAEIIFDASSSTDSDGNILNYFWDFGDGNSTSSSQATTSYAYSTSGEFVISLLVEDNENATGSVATSSVLIAGLTEEFSSLSIVINEIAWMGTAASNTSDEWIELYNNTASAINLAGWQLLISDNIIAFSTSSISAGGYFILGKTENFEIDGIPADQRFTAILGNHGEKLELRDEEGRLIDLVDCSSGWFAGTTSQRYVSMERIVSTSTGKISSNWASNNQIAISGIDEEGNKIYGTPRKQNSVSRPQTEIKGIIDYPTLTYLGSPYIIRANLNIPEGKILNIEPGVVLKLDNYAIINVEGTLKAMGEEDKKITFTNFNPMFFWDGIYFSSSSVDSEMIWVEIESAERPSDDQYQVTQVLVENSAVSFKNCAFKGYQRMGLRLVNSDSVVDGASFMGPGHGQSATPIAGIEIEKGSPTIKNNSITNNKWGILIRSLAEGDRPLIEANNFERNTNSVYALNPTFEMRFNHGTIDQVAAISGSLTGQAIWGENDFPYYVTDNTASGILVGQDKELKIEPGAQISFKWSAKIVVSGRILAQGSLEESIKFYAAASTWQAIYFDQDSQESVFDNVIVQDGVDPLEQGQINIKGGYIEFKNSTSTNSRYAGIYLENSSSSIQNSYFTNNKLGIKIVGSNAFPQLGEGNVFENNSDYDISIGDTAQWCPVLPDYFATSTNNNCN
ncbi:MAG: lamin tail domain-containing protein [Candidatus Pacebacteria bacterium]|nr:lamin tail domain-containing protein [Candidatus Paceibacterota bacterium]